MTARATTSILAALAAGLVLAACGNKPVAPDWQMNAQGSMERATAAYLSGNARVEAVELERARAEIARTGRPDLLARAELLRCAARVASLVFEPCAAFEPLRQDAAPAERAYADYLAGGTSEMPAAAGPTPGAPGTQAPPAPPNAPVAPAVALLPEAQRAVLAGGDAALAAVKDPLSQLVAAGVMLRTGRASPATIATAIDTASGQGWRRPLLAWLTIQARRADQAGATQEAERIRRRIALVERQPGKP